MKCPHHSYAVLFNQILYVLRSSCTVFTFLFCCLIISFGIFTAPCFAASNSQSIKEDYSYVPSLPSLRDEQNIDFLKEMINEGEAFSKNPIVDKAEKALYNKTMLEEQYYSPDSTLRKSIFWFRLPCKVSWISRMHGVKLVSSILSSEEAETSASKESQFKLYKNAYSHFCPALW